MQNFKLLKSFSLRWWNGNWDGMGMFLFRQTILQQTENGARRRSTWAEEEMWRRQKSEQVCTWQHLKESRRQSEIERDRHGVVGDASTTGQVTEQVKWIKSSRIT